MHQYISKKMKEKRVRLYKQTNKFNSITKISLQTVVLNALLSS